MAGVVMASSLTACSSLSSEASGREPHYNTVNDVPILGWTETDTLLYPVLLTTPPTLRTPLVSGRSYDVYCSVRMTPGYAYQNVPMQLIVQQTDTVGTGYEHVVYNMLRQDIDVLVRDSLSRPLGTTWGSLIDYEARVPNLTLRFDSAGTYRMMLIPHLDRQTPLQGIASVGIALYPR